MRHIAICGQPFSTVNFSTLSHKRYDFRKNKKEKQKILNKKCAFLFSVQHLSETCVIIWRTERDVIRNVCRSACKIPLLSHFNEIWIFSTDFRKIFKFQISWKSFAVGVELLHAGRRTDIKTADRYDVYIYFINIYFRQHNYIIKAWVEANATCFDLKIWDPRCAQPHCKELHGS